MNILYTTNELFAAKVAASMCSVFENNRDVDNIEVYIAGIQLSELTVSRYEGLAQLYKRKVIIIDVDETMSEIVDAFDTGAWNPIIVIRLAVEKLLPQTVDRVLYMDGDTIAVDSLLDLWNTDMKECVLGACIEATVDRRRRKALGMKHIPYVNSGVLLINLKIWRERELGKKLFLYCKKNEKKLVAFDQDAINGVLKGHIYYLSPRYNFYNIYWFYPYRVLKNMMKDSWYYSEKEVREAIVRPAIIHYLGEERPWRKGNRHKYREAYYYYLRKTPWREEKLEEGWELYFVCWNLFNLVIRPFPVVRYHIINGLIPMALNLRKIKLAKRKKTV